MTDNFLHYLNQQTSRGFPDIEDVLALTMPLLQQVAELHADNKVAPLVGVNDLAYAYGELWFPQAKALTPSHNLARVDALDPELTIDIAGQYHSQDGVVDQNLAVGAGGAVERPVYLPGYLCWEHEVEHHDPLTDIFCLGQILASLACNLNLSDPQDLARFVEHRHNLFELNPGLNPVLARVIVGATELSRRKRERDLPTMIETLRHYRTQIELPALAGLPAADQPAREQVLQAHLRDRLFDMTRRNRLLYFKPTQQMVNVTVASFPLLLDYKNIREEQLMYWHGDLAKQIAAEKALPLNEYLRFEDAPYLPAQLDTIRAGARRDQAEYGFSQLRLVLCFLRWHNLKEEPTERIVSPLLLLPVSLTKRKGVRDSYVIQPESSVAAVNPALRHALRQLYDIPLPEEIDLNQQVLADWHQQLQTQIRASEPGVTLHNIQRPRIQLVRQQARQRLEQFQRRNSGRGVKSLGDIEYSYQRNNLQPLGLQIFLQRVRLAPAPLSLLVDGKPRPMLMTGQLPVAASVETETYQLQNEPAGSPYDWEFDLCNLTLGNFNYRKMSLVRDYTTLLKEKIASRPFGEIFSLEPRQRDTGAAALPLAEQFPVVAHDPTQAEAIAKARLGGNLIIQGPPGTGKSQTITNLIADFVARGKRVLFICEKRAAIDVVYHRLHQQGLERLCALIHDSQADKKAFIQDLKACYEDWMRPIEHTQTAREQRQQVVQALHAELESLQRFSTAMTELHPAAGTAVRTLFGRLCDLPRVPTLAPEQAEMLPDYALWRRFGPSYEDLAQRLAEVGAAPLQQHAMRFLHPTLLEADRPLQTLKDNVELLRAWVDEFSQRATSVPHAATLPLGVWRQLADYLEQVTPLLAPQLLALVDGKSELAKAFGKLCKTYDKQSQAYAKAQAKTVDWRDKLSAEDVAAALPQALEIESRWWAVITPNYWRLRKLMATRHDSSRHAVKRKWSVLLADLAREHECAAALNDTRQTLQSEFATDDPDQLARHTEHLQAGCNNLALPVRSFHQWLQQQPNQAEWAALPALFNRGWSVLQQTLCATDHLTLPDLQRLCQALPEDSHWLAEVGQLLLTLNRGDPRFVQAVHQLPLTPTELEAASLQQTLNRIYQTRPGLSKMDGAVLHGAIGRLKKQYGQWFQWNAGSILEIARDQFLQHLALCNLPAAQLSAEQKTFKKRYNSGRRDLENEFEKVMRYKSIRELASGESGMVVRDLKPVWLMSPLSISDTIPLQGDYFDLVIFDEASQVPVEEAIPAVYRGPQVIVVGDEMQLPPSNFFGGSQEPDEDDDTFSELNADSFLSQAAKALPSTLLGWHYRSRSEALISFSNQAFYQGKLLTIPDVSLARPAPEIVVRQAEDALHNLPLALQRPISFHFVENSAYEDRRNAVEAAYIAGLVRQLLVEQNPLSIGVVAFSEAQQSEIETALKQLAAHQPDFAPLLEAAFEREEDEQFCGLFVKNLENVQGDERDIIIMSVCYGYDRQRKMLMNFGPINKAGGEKRLNVVFSRAKRHMLLVSSIRHHAITNTYNEGANALRGYLQFAQAVSIGDQAAARSVLQLLGAKRHESATTERDSIVEQLTQALTEAGYQVDQRVGHSSFRCDLGVRKEGDARYRLGILVDTSGHYAELDLSERYLLKPQILETFGWRIERVLSKDWWHQQPKVMESLLAALTAAG